jgi:hypothetical protein
LFKPGNFIFVEYIGDAAAIFADQGIGVDYLFVAGEQEPNRTANVRNYPAITRGRIQEAETEHMRR